MPKKSRKISHAEGGQGELLADPHHVRADARTVASMLSCGVIKVERAESILRKTAILLNDAFQAKKTREFAALMRVLVAAAKLGEDQPARAPAVAAQFNINTGDASRAIDRKRDIQVELEEIRLGKEKGTLIEIERVRLAFDAFGIALSDAAERIAAISPESRDILVDAVMAADRKIQELVPDDPRTV